MKVTLNIPESLDDITLKQYQEFLKGEQTQDDLLRIFLNLTEQGVQKVAAKEIDKLVLHINSLFEQKQKHTRQFVLKKIKFGFIPNLDVITYGENTDIVKYIGDYKTMHRAMSVLYRPIKQKQGKKYLINEYNGTSEYCELMREMPLSIVMGAMVFFYDLTNELLNSIPKYIEKQTKTEQMNGQLSVKNGEIIKKYTHLLKATLEDLTKLRSFQCINV